MALRDRYRQYLPDPYAALERQAIQAEEDLAPDPDSDIPGWESVVPIGLEAYREKLGKLHGWKCPKISTEQEQQSCRR